MRRRKNERKSLSPLGCGKDSSSPFVRAPANSSNGAGSQLVLPKDAGAPDEATKASQKPLAMLPKHEKL